MTKINFNLYDDFKNTYEPIKNISFDKSQKISMVDFNFKAYNFDKVKENFCVINKLAEKSGNKLKGAVPKSIDGIFEKDCILYFVEFKNGVLCDKKGQNERHDIGIKIWHSVSILSMILNKKINDLKKELIFILVFNDGIEENSDLSLSYLMTNDTRDKHKFKIFNSIFFKDTLLFTPNDFEKFINA